MSVNCRNIIKIVEYAANKGYNFFLNTYAKHGRITSPDWGIHTVDKDILKETEKDCNIFLQNAESKYGDEDIGVFHSYITQTKKIIKILQNADYQCRSERVPRVPLISDWAHVKLK